MFIEAVTNALYLDVRTGLSISRSYPGYAGYACNEYSSKIVYACDANSLPLTKMVKLKIDENYFQVFQFYRFHSEGFL